MNISPPNIFPFIIFIFKISSQLSGLFGCCEHKWVKILKYTNETRETERKRIHVLPCSRIDDYF